MDTADEARLTPIESAAESPLQPKQKMLIMAIKATIIKIWHADITIELLLFSTLGFIHEHQRAYRRWSEATS